MPRRVSGCGHRTKGAYPAGLEPTRTFGPQIEALLGYLHERHHVGYARLVEVCRDLFGLRISEGGSTWRSDGWPSGRGRRTRRSAPRCEPGR